MAAIPPGRARVCRSNEQATEVLGTGLDLVGAKTGTQGRGRLVVLLDRVVSATPRD